MPVEAESRVATPPITAVCHSAGSPLRTGPVVLVLSPLLFCRQWIRARWRSFPGAGNTAMYRLCESRTEPNRIRVADCDSRSVAAVRYVPRLPVAPVPGIVWLTFAFLIRPIGLCTIRDPWHRAGWWAVSAERAAVGRLLLSAMLHSGFQRREREGMGGERTKAGSWSRPWCSCSGSPPVTRPLPRPARLS